MTLFLRVRTSVVEIALHKHTTSHEHVVWLANSQHSHPSTEISHDGLGVELDSGLNRHDTTVSVWSEAMM